MTDESSSRTKIDKVFKIDEVFVEAAALSDGQIKPVFALKKENCANSVTVIIETDAPNKNVTSCPIRVQNKTNLLHIKCG